MKKERQTPTHLSPPQAEKWLFSLVYFLAIGLISFFYFRLTQSAGDESASPYIFRGWIGGWQDPGSLPVGLVLSPLKLVLFFGVLAIGGLRTFLGNYSRSENVGLTIVTVFSGLSVMASTPWLSLLSYFFVLMGAAIFQLNKQKDPVSGARLASWAFEHIGVLISVSLFLLIYFSNVPGSVWMQPQDLATLVPQASPVIYWGAGIAFLLLVFTAPVFSTWEVSDEQPESLVVEGMMILGVSGLVQKLAGLFTDTVISRVLLVAVLVFVFVHFIISFLSHRSRPLWGVAGGALLFFALLSARVDMREYIPLFGFSLLLLMAIYSLARESFPKKVLLMGFATFLGAGGAGSTLSSLYMASIGGLRELPERMGLALMIFFFTFACWRLFWLAIKPASTKTAATEGALSNRAWILTGIFTLPLFGLLWTGRLSGGLLGFSRDTDLILPGIAQHFLRGPAELASFSDFQLTEWDQDFMVGAVIYWSAHVLALFLAYWTTAVSQNRLKQLSGNKSAQAARLLEHSALSRSFLFVERWVPQIKAKVSREGKPSIFAGLELSRRGVGMSRGVVKFENWSWEFITRILSAGVRGTAKVARNTQVGSPKVHLAVAIWIAILLWMYFSEIYAKLFNVGSG